MDKDDIPESSDATRVEDATAPPPSVTASVEVDNHKMFTSDDLVQALAKQKLDMEANFAREMASRAAMHVPSGVALLPPQPASANTAPGPSSQSGGAYQWTYPPPKLEKPKYNFNGNPPILTKDANFLNWRVAMADYLRFVCEEMWDLIDTGKGYYPVDAKNLTPQEEFDRHLNLSAVGFIRKGMDEITRAPFLHLTNAKELWNNIITTKTGTTSLQRSRYEQAKNALHNFYMKKDETPQHLHERLKVLAANIECFTCEKSLEGYQITNGYLVDKLLTALLVYSQQMVWDIRRTPDFYKMTPDDVIATFLQYEEHKKDAKRLLALHGGSTSSNLALKAKHVQEEEDDDDEEDDGLEYYENDSDGCPSYEEMALFVKRFNKGAFKGRFQKKKTRACYNCDEPGHLAIDCPYEKREDKPRFPRKEVMKKLPNPINSKPKRRSDRAMVAQDVSDPEDVGGVAGVAQDTQRVLKLLNKEGEVVNYNYMNDYTGNAHKCLMAKTVNDVPSSSSSGRIKVTPKVDYLSSPSNASTDEFHDAEDDSDSDEDGSAQIEKMFKLMGNLKGKKLKVFQTVMEVVSNQSTYIKELETLINEEKENYSLLERNVDREEARNDHLCKTIQSTNDLNEKHVASLKKANQMCKELANDKSNLVVQNASLSKDVELLTLSLKTKEDELTTLMKSHEALKMAHIKTLTKITPPTVINVDACATNHSCTHASLIKENLSLHAQLKKGLITCAQGEKNLNEVLSHHKMSIAKEGLGFDPSTSVTKDVTLSKDQNPTKVNFVRVGHKDIGKKKVDNIVVSGKATRGKPTPNKKKEKMPPSYVLRKTKGGDVYAKFIGPNDAFRFYSIWVPKTLVTNFRGPIAKWAPLIKA